ncbi:hypothetical protein EDB85DRAFT_1888632 [Lactarius pseudohatsudake]|nr:hypothetical protein EDB85DRAFT_1888632 [Lactarius pseudohatsudake]
MPPLSPLLQSPPSSSHHCRSCSRRRVVALVACTVASFLRASVPCRDVVAVFELQLSLSQLVADFIDTVPRSWSSTWSWSVVGDAYDSGLPTAAVVVMVGVAGISEELKSGKGNAALSRVCVGTLSRVVVVVADAAPEGRRLGGCASAPQICVNPVSCRSSVREFTRSHEAVHAHAHSTPVRRMQVEQRPHDLGIKVRLCCMQLERYPIAL